MPKYLRNMLEKNHKNRNFLKICVFEFNIFWGRISLSKKFNIVKIFTK